MLQRTILVCTVLALQLNTPFMPKARRQQKIG